MGKQFLDEISRFIGLALIVLVIFSILAGLVYGLIGNLSDTGIHILATVLVFGLVGAFLLGLQIGKAHVSGIRAGLDLKLSARERDRAITKPVQSTPVLPARNLDDILPKVGTMTIIDAPSGRGEIVD